MDSMDGRGADAASSRRCGPWRAYRLVEFGAQGASCEAFRAPDDGVAVARARAVGLGHTVEVWRGSVLVGRWVGGAELLEVWPSLMH